MSIRQRIIEYLERNDENFDSIAALIKSPDGKKQIHIPDSSGNTLLHLSAAAGHHELVLLLKEMNIELDAVNHLGQTALHTAVTNDKQSICEILIEMVHLPIIIVMITLIF
jgi:ankyrin repeat protein